MKFSTQEFVIVWILLTERNLSVEKRWRLTAPSNRLGNRQSDKSKKRNYKIANGRIVHLLIWQSVNIVRLCNGQWPRKSLFRLVADFVFHELPTSALSMVPTTTTTTSTLLCLDLFFYISSFNPLLYLWVSCAAFVCSLRYTHSYKDANC